jgi:hypothetical protein
MAWVEVPPVWIGQVAGYCRSSDCMAREVTVQIKQFDPTPQGICPVCPLCRTPLKEDWDGWLQSRTALAARWPRLAALAMNRIRRRRPDDVPS